MQWLFTTIRSGLDLLFSSRQASKLAPEEEKLLTEEIRVAMAALVEGESERSALSLAARIRFAPDVQALWFLRSELMRFLAGRHGEALAREKLSALGEMFDGVLPGGLRSRPSPLGTGEESRWRQTRP
jgi:hypothetical protein